MIPVLPMIYGIPSYKIFALLGSMAFIIISITRFHQTKESHSNVLIKLILILWISMIGSRVLYHFHNSDKIITLVEYVFPFTGSGYALYGGLLSGISAIGLYALAKKRSFLEMMDCLTPGILIGLSIGRIGCLLAGCCFGKESDMIWAIRYPAGSLPHQWQIANQVVGIFNKPVSVHPTPVYEMLALGLIAFLVLYIEKRGKHFNGQVFLIAASSYSFFRLINLFFRADANEDIGLFFYPTLYMVIMLVTIMVYRYKRKKK